MNIKLGDSVIVKKGVKEPDFEEFEIGGWQGRVVDIDTKSDKDNILITIEWDSLTLKQIPSNYIAQSEQDGFDWENMTLYESELVKTQARDNKRSVEQAKDKLSNIHYWDSFGDAGIRIAKVLSNVNLYDEMECLQKWVEYLDNKLSFPIHAIVSGTEVNGVINDGDELIIKSLSHFMEIYGVIADIKFNGKKHELPLCELKAIDKTKADFQLINDHRIWFANR